MFQRIGFATAKFRFAIIIFWVAITAILTVVAPSLEEVASTDKAAFLPMEAPSVRAQDVLERVFPNQSAASTGFVIVDAGQGCDVHDSQVWAFISSLEAWLNSPDAPAEVTQAVGPTAMTALADNLISPNKRIALVGIGFSSMLDSDPTTAAVKAIDEWLLQNTPEGVRSYQSGEAALNSQSEEAAFKTMDRTLIITIILVVVILLTIYRSPVSPLIPLFAVTLAYLMTVAISAILAEHNVIRVMTDLQTILVAVMYGAGTDYCLFLISRFREEMAQNGGTHEAVRRTVRLVGETISSSAGTVFVGFMSLVFAEMGAFKSMGPMLAIGIVVSLLVGLTLVPALLAILGNRAFWPAKAQHRTSGRLYEVTSKLVSTKPVVTILIIALLMVPFSVYGISRKLNYDMLSDLPREIPAVKGYHLLQEQMGAGVLFPLTVVLTERKASTMAQEIAALTEKLSKIDGVTDVRSLHTPLGLGDSQLNGLLRVDRQLAMLLSMDQDQSIAPENPQAMIIGMQRYLNLLLVRFPELADDENSVAIGRILEGGLFNLVKSQHELQKAVKGLVERCQRINNAYMVPPMDEGDLFATLKPVYDEYVAQGDTAYRLEVVISDAIGEAGFDVVTSIREAVAGFQGEGEIAVTGFSAIYTDIRDVMNRDMARAFGFIMAGIFLVLFIMLRSIVAPIYLIATVLLSFTCTLGLTNLFFKLVLGVERLSWMLPLFMFVFLVALGIDYSIFLFGRIKEEVGYHGIREGVHKAVAATGAIITSAGIILAGTFAGMMAGEMMFLKQLGFSVAVGILIDTFVVRTILDPALATLFGRWTWWPGGVPKAPDQRLHSLQQEELRTKGTV